MPKPANEIDRRIVRTKLAIRDAMLALMANNRWDDISIQGICEQANVGRSTFYLHYQGKDDLLNESLDNLRDVLANLPSSPAGHGFPSMGGLLAHMAEQRHVFRSVIGRRSGQGVAVRFKDMVAQLMEIELKRINHPLAKRQWLARYLAGGIVEAMSWWVDAPKPPSVMDMEIRLVQLVMASIAIDFRV